MQPQIINGIDHLKGVNYDFIRMCEKCKMLKAVMEVRYLIPPNRLWCRGCYNRCVSADRSTWWKRFKLWFY